MSSLASLAVLIMISLAAINAEECSTAELLTIASNTHLEGCTSGVGFGGFSAISALTDEQIKAVCDNSDCMKLMDDMRAMNFGDCIIQGTNISLGKDILDPFAKACSGSGSVDLSSRSSSESTVGSGASGSSGATTLAIRWISSIALVLAALALQ